MPDWWERMRTLGKIAWSCPPSVLAAAQKAKTSDGETPRSTTQEPPTVEVGGVDLERFELQEANEIRELQLLRAAKWDAIVRAHKHGTPSDALQNEHRRLIDQIDKMKSRAEARLKARGVLVNVESVQADVALACELIRQMSESEARSLEERIPNLAPEQITALRQAVASISAARARILRNLRTLRSIPEALTELAVAGC